jgi:cytochrome P450
MKTVQLHDTWPLTRNPANPVAPSPRIAEIRSLGIANIHMYDGLSAAMVLRYSDTREVLMSPDVSADRRKPGFPYVSDANRVNRGSRATLETLDPPEHGEQRGMLAKYLTQKRVRNYRPFIEETVDRLIDDMEAAGQAADFVSQFAEMVPASAISRLLGLPYEDIPFFIDRVRVWMDNAGDPVDIKQAMDDITVYFDTLIDERAGSDANDLISRMIREELATGHIARQQFLLTLHLLITAGFDTTANTLALGMIMLLQDRGQWGELVEDTERRLVPGAVEEMLRYTSVAHNTPMRLAMADLPIGHTVIPAGKAILAPNMGANHDPEYWDQPEKFDIHRDARSHLAFSAGRHQCLGQQLARLELQVALERLPKRLPKLRLASDVAALNFRPLAQVYGVDSVPVRWDE